MKFALIIAAATAIRLEQKLKVEESKGSGGPPSTPQEIMDACDGDGSGGISKPEVHTCIDNFMPPGPERKQVHDMIDATFDQVDQNGDGEVDLEELRAVMGGGPPPQGGGGSGGPPGGDDDMAHQIVRMCDLDNSGGLTKVEAHDCIDRFVPPGPHRDEAHQMVDEKFDEADKDGDGQVDGPELKAAMEEHHGSGSDSDRGGSHHSGSGSDENGPSEGEGGPGGHGPPSGGPPSPQELMDMCDTDNSGGLTKGEVHACIDQMVPPGPQRKSMHDMIDATFDMVDANGDGEVDIDELRAVMGGGPPPQGGGGSGGPPGGGHGGPPESMEHQIVRMCDLDNSGGLTKVEAHDCIDRFVPPGKDRDDAHQMVDEGFDEADTDGDGQVDGDELKAAMEKHHGN